MKQQKDSLQCPVCPTPAFLGRYQAEPDLSAFSCQRCAGMWLSAEQYGTWLQQRNPTSSTTSSSATPLPEEGAGCAKLCPACGRILRRFKIWPDNAFFLDRCGHCIGVWFDQGKWEALRARHLHVKVQRFFTASWQEQRKAAESRQRFERMYGECMGDDDHTKIRAFCTWLATHPQREILLPYVPLVLGEQNGVFAYPPKMGGE